jgi:hypothetical protein
MMKHRLVSHDEFCSAARHDMAPSAKPPAPLHTEAFTEAAIILAATLAFVTIVTYALQVAGIA